MEDMEVMSYGSGGDYGVMVTVLVVVIAAVLDMILLTVLDVVMEEVIKVVFDMRWTWR